MEKEKITWIGDLAKLPGTPKSTHVKAVAYRTDAIEVSVFRLPPGAVISAHRHTDVRDLFVGIAGTGELEYLENNVATCQKLIPHAFLGLPPGVPHEVRNTDSKEDLLFLLVHAPFAGYDHIKTPIAK